MEGSHETLILLCHRADWEHRYQASAAAAAAATAGREVRMVFFFGALDALVRGEWDRRPEAGWVYSGEELAQRVEDSGVNPPSELIAAARRSGRCKLLACSASMALIGASSEDLRELVDELVGWPTIVQMMQSGAQTLYL